jgi:hypothetical protein
MSPGGDGGAHAGRIGCGHPLGRFIRGQSILLANCHGLFRISGDGDEVGLGVCNHARAGTTAHVLEPDGAIYVLEPIAGSSITAADKAAAYFESAKWGSISQLDDDILQCRRGPYPTDHRPEQRVKRGEVPSAAGQVAVPDDPYFL